MVILKPWESNSDKKPIVRPYVPAYNDQISETQINDTLDCEGERDFVRKVVSTAKKTIQFNYRGVRILHNVFTSKQ